MQKISPIFLLGISLVLFGAGCTNTDVSENGTNPQGIQEGTSSASNTQETTPMPEEDDGRNTVTVSGITFDLLPEWTVNSIEDDTAYIHVPDPDYEVTVPFSVTLRDIELQEDFLLTTTDAGIKIYDEACAPVLGCWYLVRGEEIYLAAFEVAESTEPMPADLGGVWFPSVDVSDEELYNIILSAR